MKKLYLVADKFKKEAAGFSHSSVSLLNDYASFLAKKYSIPRNDILTVLMNAFNLGVSVTESRLKEESSHVGGYGDPSNYGRRVERYNPPTIEAPEWVDEMYGGSE